MYCENTVIEAAMSCSPTLTGKGTGEAVRKGSFWGLGPCNCIDSFKNKTVRLGTNNYLTIWMGFTLKRLQDCKVMAGPTVPLTGLCLGGMLTHDSELINGWFRHQDWIRYTVGLGPSSKFFSLCYFHFKWRDNSVFCYFCFISNQLWQGERL